MEDVLLRDSIAYFDNYCPNCRGIVDDSRLEEGLTCIDCCPEHTQDLCNCLKDRNRLLGMEDICRARGLVDEFCSFFRDVVGDSPWSLQVAWAKRVFLGRSFAIQAPTGIGKTTFGVVMASFLPVRSYIILPTKLLVEQVYTRIHGVVGDEVVAYTGKRREKEAIKDGKFRILVTTAAFLRKNLDILPDDFGFIFVDDVDSLLKNPRNIDHVFRLLGLKQEEIDRAMEPQVAPEEIEGIRANIKGVLVVSSATLKPKTRRVSLFRRLLGFDIQRSVSVLREVEDLYTFASSWEDACNRALELIRVLGRGVFVFVSPDRGREGVDEFVGFLKSHGVEAVPYYRFMEEAERFERGEVPVAVGISISNNALVRGVDMPYAVRAALFLGVPRFLIPLRPEPDPQRLFQLVRLLLQALEDERLVEYLSYLRKYSTLKAELLERYPPVKRKVQEICRYLEELLSDGEVRSRLSSSDKVYLEEVDGELFLVVGDATSYIQASGRTSRLIPGGITKGLSVVIATDKKAFMSLAARVRYLLPSETVFKPLEEVDLEGILEELERSRSLEVRERKELFRSALVVVESPNKARTISSFFGRPQRRWLGNVMCYEIGVGNLYLLVTASVGHVVDLTTKPGFFGVLEESGAFKPVYSTIKRCPCGNQIVDNSCVRCGGEVESDKMELLEGLRRLAFEVDEVYIATDPDAEGEKIAWDLYLALRPFNENIKRIEFHEVTPHAFREALVNRRGVDMDRVKAQIVRRVADRWVGFTLSQRLQRHFNNRNLSAGRVQTPVLGWVIERDAETRKRMGLVEIHVSGYTIRVEAEPERAKEIYSRADSLEVELSEPFEDALSPSPPYTTSDMLKEASSFLGLSAEDAMRFAQELFEGGYITYHRTDSTRVSSAGIRVAKDFIEERYPGLFRPRKWGEGGAHECIRPTRAIPPEQLRVMKHAGELELDERALRLYRLIFNRFMASQMADAEVVKRKVSVLLDGEVLKEEEVVVGVKEPGFTLIRPVKVYSIDHPRVSKVTLRFVPRQRPFTEGTLVDEMKRRGLGRPSTYAKIVQTIINRGYVVRKRGFLRSTPLGVKVFNYLKNFHPYTSEEFTRHLEEYMDQVEERKRDYMDILRELYSVRELLQENP